MFLVRSLRFCLRIVVAPSHVAVAAVRRKEEWRGREASKSSLDETSDSRCRAATTTQVLDFGIGPGLIRARVGPGPNTTHSRKRIKSIIRSFKIRANFIEGTIGAVYYSKRRANAVFFRYWNKKCKSLASMHRMNSVPFLCVSRSVMMAFSPHLTSVLPMYDVITNQLAGESFIIEVFELLFHPPMPPHVLDTFCALGSQGTGRNNPKTNTHTSFDTNI